MMEFSFDKSFSYRLIDKNLATHNNLLSAEFFYVFNVPSDWNVEGLSDKHPSYGKEGDKVVKVSLSFRNKRLTPSYGFPGKNSDSTPIIGKDYKSCYQVCNTIANILYETMFVIINKQQDIEKIIIKTTESPDKSYLNTKFNIWRKFLDQGIPGGRWESDGYVLPEDYQILISNLHK